MSPPPASPVEVELRQRTPGTLDAVTLYQILRLRVDVFVVEQQCPYPELDGRDLEPGARWVWAQAADSTVLGTLRVLREPDGSARIGRVATAPSARSAGLGGRMMRFALERVCEGESTVVLDAQAHLANWYSRFGFQTAGEVFIEDGIEHVPMRRAAGSA